MTLSYKAAGAGPAGSKTHAHGKIKKVMFLDLKRSTAMPALYSAAFFTIIVLGQLVLRNREAETVAGALRRGVLDPEYKDELLTLIRYSHLHAFTGIYLIIYAMLIFGAVEAVRQFGFLYSRQQSDFYLGMPEKRKTLFFRRYLSGIVSVVLPYLVFQLIGTAAGMIGVKFHAVFIQMPAEACVVNIVFYLFMYTLCTALVILSGKILTGLILILGVSFIFPYLAAVTEVLYSLISPSGASNNYILLLDKIEYISPVMLTYRTVEYFEFKYSSDYEYSTENRRYFGTLKADAGNGGNYTIHVALFVIIAFLFAAAFLFVSLKLFEMRKNEKAGDAFVFRFTARPLQYMYSLCGGVTGAAIFSVFSGADEYAPGAGTAAAAAVGALFGAVIVHLIFELICSGDMKKIFSHKVQLIVEFISMVLLIAVMLPIGR